MHASKDKGKLTKAEREEKQRWKQHAGSLDHQPKLLKVYFIFLVPGACVLAEANMSKRMAPKASRGRLH